MIFRKVAMVKFSLVALFLVLSFYVFTYHSEKLQPHYNNLKSQINWNKDDASKSDPKGALKADSEKTDAPESASEPAPNAQIEPALAPAPVVKPEDQVTPGDSTPYSYDPTKPEKEHENKNYFSHIEPVDNDAEFDPALHPDWDESRKAIMAYVNSEATTDKNLKLRTSLFAKIFELIEDSKPTVQPLKEYKDGHSGVQFVHNEETPFYTKDQLLSFLVVTEDEKKDLMKHHETLVTKLLDSYPDNIYEPDSKGIVYVGGNKFSWLTLISIMNLRAIGSKLPVEVLIPKYEEYELNICQEVFPHYNAKCIYLPKLVGEKIYNEHDFKGYQYKSLALALSSFENVLLLDADNTPLKDPELLFSSNPFKDHGMVLWPDFWKRTTHPYFYDIIGINIDDSKRRDYGYHEYGHYYKPIAPEGTVLFHQLDHTMPDPTSESGQVLFSKKKHFKSLVLSLYYNTYGPDYYYPLLSQGAAGEGDKETFLAAAHALGESYYAVKKHVIPLGRFRDGNFHGSAMGQYDAVQDYELFNKYAESTEDIGDRPDFFFVHANFPKMDPWSLKKDDIIYDAAKDERNRLFGEGFIDDAKYDFELQMWGFMKDLLCEQKLEFINFSNEDLTSDRVCSEVLEQYKYLESTTKKN